MRIASQELGSSGDYIVILHGLFGSSSNWVSMARKLSSKHRVISVDLPNHGLSEWSNDISYESHAHDLAEFICKKCSGTVTLLGHSMGGKLAMVIAFTRPDLIKRLIIVDIAPVNRKNS